MKSSFSYNNRKQILEQLKSITFDILVIGGGITGAGIALDAASRGLKVALIEKHDFASGTSSRSTKLIHGGLRYLKQLEIGLVHETGTERAILHKNAPHVVHAENMLLPIIQNGSLGKFSSSLGLWVYDYLAGVNKDERRVMLNKQQTLHAEPLLRNDVLIGGGLYKEYRTDDARLTTEVLKTAVAEGAICINYVQANNIIYSENKVASGIVATNVLSNENITIRAKKIINATGPWVDELRKTDNSLKGKSLHLTKGVHLVVAYEKLPVKQAVYFDVADGRMIFTIPRGKITYIGTTDTNYKEKKEEPVTTKDDVNYLLGAVNYMFPLVKIKIEDIISTWAGLRPLIHEDGKSPSELSRKDEIFISESGLISIAGGKLTGFRKMAERAVNLALQQLNKEQNISFKASSTKNKKLSGAEGLNNNQDELHNYKQKLAGQASQIEISFTQVAELVDKYGTNTEIIIEYAYELKSSINNADTRILVAELQYGIQHEMVCNLSDFLIRRTGRLYFERNYILSIYNLLKPYAEKLFEWNESTSKKQHEEFMNEYESVMKF